MKIIYILLLFLLICLNACFFPKVRISKEDQALIPYKQKKIKLVFQNQDNKFDEIYLEKLSGNWESNFKFWLSNRVIGKGKRGKRAFAMIYTRTNSLSKLRNTINTHLNFHFIKGFFNETLIILIRAGDWIQEIKYINNYQTEKIEGTGVLEDLIIMENIESNSCEIKKLFWSTKYGLVKIEKKDGSIWTLVLNCSSL